MSWWITCPNTMCKFRATLEDFGPSCTNGCTCPKCEKSFQVDLSAPDDEDDDDDFDEDDDDFDEDDDDDFDEDDDEDEDEDIQCP